MKYIICIILGLATSLLSIKADSLFERGERKSVSELKAGDKIIIESAALAANAGKYLKAQPDVTLFAETSFIYSAGLDQYSIWELVATGSNDPTYTAKPTYYLRSVNGGYYLGFSTDDGTNNVRCLTTMKSKAYPFVLLNTTEAKTTSGSSPNWDTKSIAFQSTAKAIQLGNSPTASNNTMVWMWSPSSANASTHCPWNVYEAVEGQSADEILADLQALIADIDAEGKDYDALGNFQAVASLKTALANAKKGVGSSATAMYLLDLYNKLQAARSGLQEPQADLLDVQFNADGSATDISPAHHSITKVGNPVVTYNEEYGRNMVSLTNAYGGAGMNFYKTGLYSGTPDFITKLSDGHSIETVFRTRLAIQNKEAKVLSSHQAGGTGLMICTQGNGKNGGNEITFLPNIGGWKWATSGVIPEVDVYYHVVGVWNKDEGQAYIYINGELKNTVSANGTLTLPSASSQWFGIGADPSGNNGEASGSWDIVTSRIYDQPLTDYQVSLLYGDMPQAPDPLVKDLDFMGGLTMKEGAKFPIEGIGFETGDRIKLTSGAKTYTLDLAVREGGCHFVIPQGFTSATYTMTLLRGDKTQTLGSCPFVIADKMPGGCQVIAHRGWWTKGAGTAQNSRQSLRNAIELDCYGSETDVWITTDGHIMVSHDGVQNGVGIQGNTYNNVKNLKLTNGETLPELNDFFDLMEEYPDSRTKLIIELKYNSATDVRANAKKIVAAVKARKMQDRVEYISYSREACQQIAIEDPDAWVAYLGTVVLPPSEIYPDGIKGTDYQTSHYQNNPTWIEEAEALGMTTNVYTIDTQAGIVTVTNMGINFVTTNYPDIAQRIYRLYEYNLPPKDTPAQKAQKSLSLLINQIDTEAIDYSAPTYIPASTAPFFDALAEARTIVADSTLTAEAYATAEQTLAQCLAAIVKYPVADALDVVFASDGSAVDVSPLQSNIETVGALRTYNLSAYDSAIPVFMASNGTEPADYYKIMYADTKSDGCLKKALMGGHTLESVFRICQPSASTQAHWFSAYNKGACGLMTCATEEGLNKHSEISYILNVSPGGSSTNPIVVASGIEAKVDTFYHVVAVWNQDSTSASIYVNGKLCNEVSAVGEMHFSIAATYQWICLGGAPATATKAGNGGMFDIVTARIYDQGLCPLQVAYLWEQASADLAMANAEPTATKSLVAECQSEGSGAKLGATYWTTDGKSISSPQKGINIVRSADGIVTKEKH